jgi:DegV family protein with EDD domain
MGKYAVVLDSTVYFTKEFLKQNDIEVVSLYITDELGNTYKVKDITRELIIEEQSKGRTFKTSAPGPGEFTMCFESLLEKGYEHIFVIGLSKELSGTYQSSVVGRNMLDNPNSVTVFDTNQSAYGNEMLVLKLLEKINSGHTKEDIETSLNEIIQNSRLMFTCENLFSLVRGGRLSTTRAMIGTVLRMKPIINMLGGKLLLHKTERTYKNVFSIIINQIKDSIQPEKKLTVYITDTYSEKSGDMLTEAIKLEFPNANIIRTNLLGPVMTVHVGNKGFGISWYTE